MIEIRGQAATNTAANPAIVPPMPENQLPMRVPIQVALAVGVLVTLSVSSPSAAALITFEEFNNPSAFFPGESLSSEGFTIENLGSLPAEVSLCSPPCADNGSQSLLTQADGMLRLTDNNGQAFSLASFDAAESFSGLTDFWAREIVVAGFTFGGDTVSEKFTLDLINDGPGGEPDFQSFMLPPSFANVTSVVFTGGGNTGRNDFSLDNLSITTVPEPATFGLCIVGLMALVSTALRPLHPQ